jgi:[protein-PII] uridylyltransferase
LAQPLLKGKGSTAVHILQAGPDKKGNRMPIPRPKNDDASEPYRIYEEQRNALLSKVGSTRATKLIKRHATLVDEYFLSSFSQSAVGPQMGIMRNPYSLIALGGYGRAEQCAHSDIDLLFLFENKVPAEAEDLVREIVYPLWDLGLEVGHATRSIKECIQLARQDYEVLTSLVDGRFICGISPLYHRLMERLRIKLVNVKPNKIIDWLIESNKQRHGRFGDSSYLLEPNLKEGQGGLRDYHTMLWIARIQSNIKEARDLEYYGYLSHDEFRQLETALDFVWDVRNQLHLLTGRKCDQLHLENQTKLAEVMGVEGFNGHLPVERLLGDLHANMEFIKQCYKVFVYELDQKKRLKRKNKALKDTQVPGLKFNRGLLNFESPEAILKNPTLLIQIFAESSVHKAPLNAEARRLVQEFGDLVEQPDYRSDPQVVNAFEKILMRPTLAFDTLNTMLDTGFLDRFIPGFKEVINRIQFDQYHLYPVARHLLRSVRLLKSLISDKHHSYDPFAHRLYREIRNKKALFWAILLHDIGKGEPSSGHSERGARMARDILTEKGMTAGDIETVEFLVREHLLLFETATRRDINEEETALLIARRIERPGRLKMLYLLSVADAMATGPKAWNDWTASLMRSLFLKSLNSLERGELASRRAVRIIEEKKERILTASRTEKQRTEYSNLLSVMSPRYLLNTPSQEIPQHIELFQTLETRDFVWRIDRSKDENTRKITLCAKDRPGLLSKIAGTFTLSRVNILGVHLFTWRNNVALDIFEVEAPPDPLFEANHWKRTALNLQHALDGEVDLTKELKRKLGGFKSIQPFTKDRPQKVTIDNEMSSFFTIVEVVAWDYPGLLYRITDALFRCGLDIWVAKIATQVDQVVDVFYVRNFDGEKVDRPEEEALISDAIRDVLK